MNYRAITQCLSGHGIDTSKETSPVNSKWVYSKELLTGAPDELILRIATELEIPHSHVVLPGAQSGDSRFWEPNYFRFFVTHLSAFKKTTTILQRSLRQFAISGFVAHVDITPTKEWQHGIEVALFSMDALAAILMPGFKESGWTEQEVGLAIGRGVLVIPIIHGLDPYGFIGKYQGLSASGRTVIRVARDIFDILLNSERARPKILSCVIDVACRTSAAESR